MDFVITFDPDNVLLLQHERRMSEMVEGASRDAKKRQRDEGGTVLQIFVSTICL